MLTWLLADDKPGNVTQSVGLLEALNLPYERKQLRFDSTDNPDGDIPAGASRLAPPWPELVIATGGRTAQAAEWVKRRSGGRTRVIQLGRKGGRRLLSFDAVIAPFYARLPRHDNLIETLLPLCRINQSGLQQAALQWPELLDDKATPKVVALVGGHNGRFQWNAEIAYKFAVDLTRWVSSNGGSLTMIASRRTGQHEIQALELGMGGRGELVPWQPDKKIPYRAYLARAEVLVVTADSESMLAEALATTHPVYLYRLVEKNLSMIKQSKNCVRTALYALLKTRRSYARWVHNGIVLPPPRDFEALHARLAELGYLYPFTPQVELMVDQRESLNEAERAAEELHNRGLI